MTDNIIAQFWAQCWQVSLLVGIVAIVDDMWLRGRPYWSYSLWTLVVVKALVPPIWSSRIGIFSWCQVQVANSAVDASSSFASLTHAWISTTLSPTGLATVLMVWVLGALVCLTLALVRWRAVYIALTKHRVETPMNVRQALARIQSALPIGSVPVYGPSPPTGPAALGLWRPKLLLPEAVIAGRTAAELEPILAHELMHIRRGDTFFSILRTIAQSVWWFNPLIWIATRRASYQCERCVDADVMSLMRYAPAHYAASLLSVLESKCQLKSVLGSAGMNAFQVTENRLRFIMCCATRPSRRQKMARSACLLLLILLTLPGSRLVLAAESLIPVSHAAAGRSCGDGPFPLRGE